MENNNLKKLKLIGNFWKSSKSWQHTSNQNISVFGYNVIILDLHVETLTAGFSQFWAASKVDTADSQSRLVPIYKRQEGIELLSTNVFVIRKPGTYRVYYVVSDCNYFFPNVSNSGITAASGSITGYIQYTLTQETDLPSFGNNYLAPYNGAASGIPFSGVAVDVADSKTLDFFVKFTNSNANTFNFQARGVYYDGTDELINIYDRSTGRSASVNQISLTTIDKRFTIDTRLLKTVKLYVTGANVSYDILAWTEKDREDSKHIEYIPLDVEVTSSNPSVDINSAAIQYIYNGLDDSWIKCKLKVTMGPILQRALILRGTNMLTGSVEELQWYTKKGETNLFPNRATQVYLYYDCDWEIYADGRGYKNIQIVHAGINSQSNVGFKEKVTLERVDDFTFDKERGEIYAKSGNIVLREGAKEQYHDAWNNVEAYYEDGYIYYSNTYGALWQKIPFDTTAFPTLIAGSKVISLSVLPYTRRVEVLGSQVGYEARVVVLTDKKQTFHNEPDTTQYGTETYNGMWERKYWKFCESVIWDIPISETTRRLPSKSSSANGIYRYMPCLSDDSYEFLPALNTDLGYGYSMPVSRTLSDGRICPRFYHHTELGTHPLIGLGEHIEKDNKLCAVGTYVLSYGRVVFFVTHDGGKQWFAKYDFAAPHYGTVETTVGVPIDLTAFSAVGSGVFSVRKRSNVYPTAENKEPSALFSYGEYVNVTSISNTKPTVVTTASAHGLNTLDVVEFKLNSSSPVSFLANNNSTTMVAGDGVLFQVKKLTDTTFELYEMLGSADTNIPARHIHTVNRVKDGWTISTGEDLPEGGWIMFAQQKQRDAGARVMAWETFPVFRLNSVAGTSCERACGFIMEDNDVDPYCFYASDTAMAGNRAVSIEGRTGLFTRSSLGIMRGKLSVIDDMSQWECVYSIPDTIVALRRLGNFIVAVSQAGDLIISNDNGENWHFFKTHSRCPLKGISGRGKMIVGNYFVTEE